MSNKNLKPEFAEDDRVIGIPHTMATSGDKLYIVNGRILSGWSMFFSLTAIKSPENYSQIVDIVYNVPYIFSAIQMRASLSLGARFDVVDDPTTDNDDKIVKFARHLLIDKLNLDGRMLKKISAHMDIYGNSYVHVRRDQEMMPDKLTILQPERLKIFLDPMTTKILFYIYLPPIIGGTVLVPYPYEKANPNLIQNIALTYPTPIVIPPEDIIHLKQQDWTEYPFGFSLLRSCMEPAQARLDYTILSPIIYKHYAKPLVHWKIDPTGLNPGQVKTRMSNLKSQIESMEPTSDMITTNKWETNVIAGAAKGFSAIFDMISDSDTQIFAALGVPETYFKPRGTTDRMVSEQDKIFVKQMKDRQEYFAEEIKRKLLYPAIKAKFEFKDDMMPRVKLQWRKMIMSDESIEIQNTIALLQMAVIDMDEARRRLALPKTPQKKQEDLASNFLKESTESLNKQIPAVQGNVPLGNGTPKPSPEKTSYYEMHDESDTPSDLLQKSGESDVAYDLRMAQKYGTVSKTPNKHTEFAESEIHMEGKVGQKAEIEVLGPAIRGEHVSSRKCPFCRDAMFESQDLKTNESTYRCRRHGYM